MSESITVQELKSQIDQNKDVKLIDVRTPVEYREVHASNAHLYPLDALDPKAIMEEMAVSKNEKLYIICQSGARSKQACDKFQDAGYLHITYIEGGTKAWVDAGYEAIRGKKAISLERQVRIAAGFLILLGVSLGFGVHWGFFGISGFVGAGLMFAGITDTCGMAIMLAKMPWNRIKPEKHAKAAPAKST